MLEINFTLIVFTASFLVFIYLLNLSLYRPVGKVIEGRKNLISGEYEQAKELSTCANDLLESYKDKIKKARGEAHNIIQSEIDKANKNKQEKINELLAILSKEKEEALKQLQIEQDKTLKTIEGHMKSLTDLITSKVLGANDLEKTLAGTH